MVHSRLLIIWSEVPGYLDASLRKLCSKYPINISVISNPGNRTGSPKRAFKPEMLDWLPSFITIHGSNPRKRYLEISQEIDIFDPDVILFGFHWSQPENHLILRKLKNENRIVISAMDNPWIPNFKQYLLVYLNSILNLFPFNAVWVPGERAYQYARRLYSKDTIILKGLYTADSDLFQSYRKSVKNSSDEWPKEFLFVGRIVSDKGINTLISAYRDYRKYVASPWNLRIVGDGLIDDKQLIGEGVTIQKFKQPNVIADIMSNSGVFILPSHFEPWGVVIHEAILTGLPIICSRECGASVELVQDGFNGYTYYSKDIKALVKAMCSITENEYQLSRFSNNSEIMSSRYSTDLWADNLVNLISEFEERTA